MKKDNDILKEIKEILDNIQQEDISLIDFDKMYESLTEISKSLNKNEVLAGEYKLIRDDYIARISGMVKAIAICGRTSEKLQVALDLIDELQSMSSEQLIACYKKTSAKFRDSFPTTFKSQYSNTISRSMKKEIESFK